MKAKVAVFGRNVSAACAALATALGAAHVARAANARIRPPAPKDTARSNFDFSVVGQASLRRFDDVEPSNQSARSYQAFPVPGISVDAEAFPLLDGHLGLEAEWSQSLGAESTTADNQGIETTSTVIDAMLKSRWFTAHRDRAPWFSIGAGYRYSTFTFDSAPPDREIPAARYHMLRGGLDARVPIDRVILFFGVNYDRALLIGPLGTARAAGEGNGFDARLGASIQVLPWLFARLEVRYSWLGFALVRDVPASALDQTATAGAGAEVLF